MAAGSRTCESRELLPWHSARAFIDALLSNEISGTNLKFPIIGDKERQVALAYDM